MKDKEFFPGPIVMRAAQILLLIVFLSPLNNALGADFTVNSGADAADANPGDGICDDGSGNCTLRAAIMEANASVGADTITLLAGTYTLSITPETTRQEEAEDDRGDFDIIDGIVIIGAGEAATIIDGARVDRVFDIHAGCSVTIGDVTIQNGYSATKSGGGINNAGDLALNHSTVTLCESLNHSGGIRNSGTLTISNCTINENQTGGGEAAGASQTAERQPFPTAPSSTTYAETAAAAFRIPER